MVSRRDFLKIAGLGAGAALLNGCAPQLTPTPQPPDALRGPAPIATPARTATPRIVSPTPEMGTPTPEAATPTAWHFTPGPGPGAVNYQGRKLCFVLWDHQLAQYGFRPRNMQQPVPETCKLFSDAVNPMTPEWEAYWRDILRLCNPDVDPVHFEHAWSSLVDSGRAFTNHTGAETGNFALHSLTCGGATLEMVTGEPEHNYMRIYTLNWNDGPPPIPSTPNGLDMTRHFFATTGSNVKLPDGSYAVYGFPQFDNCIIPLMSQADTDLIEASRIKAVDSIQRPYNP